MLNIDEKIAVSWTLSKHDDRNGKNKNSYIPTVVLFPRDDYRGISRIELSLEQAVLFSHELSYKIYALQQEIDNQILKVYAIDGAIE